ncbi:MAG: ectoine synthase [Nitriliruptor sp.]|uniref:ectoine synthase n=1 Tax=Nitriliruptor sp. TaxID=2448056 RepID=UPI0034A05357
MIVRTRADLDGTDRVTVAGTWSSHRLLLARDGQSFSFHDTTLHAGTETQMWYRNHVEAVYCVGGTGVLEDLDEGVTYPLADGTMYCLDGNERHIVRAHTDLRMICVFDPPVTGQETHDVDGAYPLLTDA